MGTNHPSIHLFPFYAIAKVKGGLEIPLEGIELHSIGNTCCKELIIECKHNTFKDSLEAEQYSVFNGYKAAFCDTLYYNAA